MSQVPYSIENLLALLVYNYLKPTFRGDITTEPLEFEPVVFY
jgi:hypothetical protein